MEDRPARSSTASRSEIRVSLHSTIQDIDPGDWNRLAAGNAFASHGWLLTSERCWLARFKALYVVLRMEGTVAAGAACYEIEDSPLVESLDDMLLGRLKRFVTGLGVSFLPALVCGPPQGYGWHIGVDAGLDPADQDRIRRQVLDAMEAEADRRGLPLSFALVLDEEMALCALLDERHYLVCRNVPVAVMEVPWGSIDEYFALLPAKRRHEFRRQRRRNHEAGAWVELLAGGAGLDERFLTLLDNNAREHGAAGVPFGRRFLRELRANTDAGALCFVARKGAAVSGAYLVLRRGDTAMAYAVGVDPDLGGDDFTYFELVYYRLIEYAIEYGIKRVYFGRGMYEMKVRRGCFLVEALIYTRRNWSKRLLNAAWYRMASLWNHFKLRPEIRRELPKRGMARRLRETPGRRDSGT